MQAQKTTTLGTMLGCTAHEYNNQIMGVQYGVDACLRMLSSGTVDFKNMVRLLTISKEAAGRIHSFNESILSLSRKEAVKTKIIDIKLIINKITDFYIPLLSTKGIEIKIEHENNYPHVLGNFDQLVTVFLNLLNNSKDALAKIDNALIEVFWQTKTLTPEDIPVQFFDAKPGEYLEVSVSDNGSGIEEDMLSKVFEPYITTKGKQGGTGLGLPTVVDIIKQHGGILTCESQLGKGTSFSVFLPVAQ